MITHLSEVVHDSYGASLMDQTEVEGHGNIGEEKNSNKKGDDWREGGGETEIKCVCTL